jgi:hypothetical protein
MITIEQHLPKLKDKLLSSPDLKQLFEKGHIVQERELFKLLDENGKKLNFTDTEGAYFYLVLPDSVAYDNSQRPSPNTYQNIVTYKSRLVIFAPKRNVWEVELLMRWWFANYSNEWELLSSEVNKWQVFVDETGVTDIKNLDKIALVALYFRGRMAVALPKTCEIKLNCGC